MDFIHLVYFFEVARQESFTKASEVLYVSQSTISKLIKNLESELGVALFYRTPKRVILTDAGQLLLTKTKIIIETLNSIHPELSDLTGTPRGRLKIGMSPMVQTLFPQAIAEFKSLYPQIIIDLIEVGSKKVEQGISEGTIDVGIMMLPTRGKEELVVFPFMNDPMMLIVHPNHPLATKQFVDMYDLRDEPFVLYKEDFALHDHIIEKCQELGFEPHIVCETAQWDFMVNIVASKLGIAFLPHTLCAKISSQLIKTLPVVNGIIPWNLALVWKNNTYLSYPTKVWLKHIFKVFGIAESTIIPSENIHDT
ncbi:MAG: LysR family transcriptional regulator [Negativicutes bacterium]|nr:LysR family transcriptional regulator [Negativicutes bacterium]